MKKTVYDTIVVGAGSAGCVIAARLSEDPGRQVLLLEAGPDYAPPATMPDVLRGFNGNSVHGSTFNWAYSGRLTAGGPPSLVTRGRVIGGSGTVNGSVFVRGLPEDYDSWGSPRWTYEGVLPCFRRLETDLDFGGPAHGKDGPIPVYRQPEARWSAFHRAFYEAARAAGFPHRADFNDGDATGVGPMARNDPGGLRVNCALAYLDPNRDRPNLTIRGDTTVTRVLLRGPRATGVEAVAEGRTIRFEGGQVVLCAGAIGSPALLLRSGIGPAAGLARCGIDCLHDLAGVGENLRDHPVAGIRLLEADPTALLTSGVRTQTVLAYTAAGSPHRNDMRISPYAGYPLDPNPVTGVQAPTGVRLTATIELPSSTGRLWLEPGPGGPVLSLEFNHLQESVDRARLRESVRLAADLARDPAWRGVAEPAADPGPEVLDSDRALDGWLLAGIGSASHSVGTCKLGPASDPRAVVDDRCHLHGLEGLAVADLSIVPAPVRANPNATAVMIGERASDLLEEGR